MTVQQAVGWTLLHFLWQGAIVTLLYAVVDFAARRASSQLRYGLATVAMAVMFVYAVGTFAVLAPSGSAVAPVPIVAGTFDVLPHNPAAFRPAPDYMPWVVYLWITGVAACSLRLAKQWFALRMVRRNAVRRADDAWTDRLARLAARLGVRRAVLLYESVMADVPAVVGWLKPVILVPAGVMASLSPEQVEALLIHELAHVRRHDYLVNLMQSCMETLFFYHPGVWWLSRRMRDERENCCDDVAVAECGDPLRYARALAEMETLRGGMPTLAMAANGGSLLRRVKRLIAPRTESRSVAPIAFVALAVVAVAVALWAAPQSSVKAEAREIAEPQALAASQAAKEPRAAAEPRTHAANGETYLDGIEKAGYHGLSVDELVAFKIHGVTPEFIGEMKALGFKLSPDELVSLCIHGVDAAYVKAWKQAGYPDLDLDNLLAFKIHGATPEFVAEMKALGLKLSPDEVLAVRIHGVDAAYVKAWKQAGYANLDVDHLLAFKIHGANAEELRELQGLGLKDLSPDNIIQLRIFGVTPDFVRETRKRGLGNLDVDKLVQLKQMGILDRP